MTRLLPTKPAGDRIIMGAADDVFTQYSSNPSRAITAKYARTGGPASWLGNPASGGVTGLRSGGAYQVFRGGSIYLVRGRWCAHGRRGDPQQMGCGRRAEREAPGCPTADEGRDLKDGGAFQGFQGGRIHWSPGDEEHITRGGILSAWAASGYERGVLATPQAMSSPSVAAPGADLQGGTITWTAQAGAPGRRRGHRRQVQGRPYAWPCHHK